MKTTKLKQLTSEDIEKITLSASKKENVTLVKSKQINMRLDSMHLEQSKLLAKAEGVPFDTFLTRLLKEDIDRLWRVYRHK